MKSFLGKIKGVEVINNREGFMIYICAQEGTTETLPNLCNFLSEENEDEWAKKLFKCHDFSLSKELSYYTKLTSLLSDARVNTIHELVDTPVEIMIDDSKDVLVWWRVLTEVL